MILPDVNVLINSYRSDAPDHLAYKSWFEDMANADAPFAIADFILSSFLRVVTHPRIFDPPTPLGEAIDELMDIKGLANHISIAPGPRHWEIFLRLCRDAGARGNLVPDAYIAALAIEAGCELVTGDRDFARFPGLRWRHPLAS